MATPTAPRTERACEPAAWLLSGSALILVLVLHLLPALLAGLLIYELVHLLAPRLRLVRIERSRARLVAAGLLVTGIVVALALAAAGVVLFISSEAGSVPALMQKMADILERWRTTLPASVVEHLPADLDEVQIMAATWLRGHAGALQNAGTEAGRTAAHVIIGVVVGALVAVHDVQSPEMLGPLGRALQARTSRLGDAFRRVVFGQVRISAINALITALYLDVALPISGVHLPLAKTMIVVVFLVGMLPIVGNLVSNTIIVVLSLSVSLPVALVSLAFLVVIHKLEYFLNAHIIGAQVHAHAWELLIAMLVMEAAFGVPGLIAAPIYYAYVKNELVSRQLV